MQATVGAAFSLDQKRESMMSAEQAQQKQDQKRSGSWRWLMRSDVGPLLALVIVVLLFLLADRAFGSGAFGTMRNFRSMLANASMIAVPALGMTAIIIAGGIDLSAGCALALATSTLAFALEREWGWPVAVGAALLTGALCGAFNGLIVAATGIVPFVVTLGSMSIFLGIASLVTAERTIEPRRELIPVWLAELSSSRGSSLGWEQLPKLPTGVLFAGFAAMILAVLLHRTVFGRHLYAVGSNERTARLCGIPVAWVKLSVYTLGGLFVGIGALYQFSFVKQAGARDGIGLELQYIAAVVIGGGSLSGGRGSVIGTLAGACLAAVIDSGCIQLSLPNPTKSIILGGVVIIAVAIDRFRTETPEWLARVWQPRQID